MEYEEIDRPDWIDYYIDMAFFASQRSEDPNTQHGCILTTKSYHIIGTGYNALARKTTKGLISNTRPKKYQRIIHAEENALLNCMVAPKLLADGAIAFVTAKPCIRCLDRMWNSNIDTIYWADTGYNFVGWESESEDFDALVEDVGLSVYKVVPNLKWLEKPIETIKKYNKLNTVKCQ